MNIIKTLHKISYLKYLFLFVEIFLIIYAFSISSHSEELVSIVGILILVTGIQLGLESLGDVSKMSEKEIKMYQMKKNIKVRYKLIYYTIVVLATISLLFFSLKFFGSARNEAIFNEFFNLGLNLWALILGLLCLLKYINDKESFANAQINNVQ